MIVQRSIGLGPSKRIISPVPDKHRAPGHFSIDMERISRYACAEDPVVLFENGFTNTTMKYLVMHYRRVSRLL